MERGRYTDGMNNTEKQAWASMIDGAWSIDIPASAARTALTLRLAKSMGDETYAEVIGMALARRRDRLTYDTVTQRRWQTRVSRRPQRGNHHDSWSIRERYVTGRS